MDSDMERVGLRLQLRKQQAEAGDIVLLLRRRERSADPSLSRRAWAKSGADLRVPAPGTPRRSRCWGRSTTSPASSSSTPARPSAAVISSPISEQLDRLFGPQPGRQAKPVVLVEDNCPIHASKRSRAALAARARWLTVEWLPKYAPELNEIEPVWRVLKAHHLAHQTFTDAAALDLRRSAPSAHRRPSQETACFSELRTRDLRVIVIARAREAGRGQSTNKIAARRVSPSGRVCHSDGRVYGGECHEVHGNRDRLRRGRD